MPPIAVTEKVSKFLLLEKHKESESADKWHWDPMDIQACLRTTLLCTHCIFSEPGISRLIANSYKDLLLQDVLGRLADYHQTFVRRDLELKAFRRSMPMGISFPPPGIQEFKQHGASVLHIVAVYMKYFKNEVTFMIEALSLVKQCSIWHCGCPRTIVELALDDMIAGVVLHPDELVEPFVDVMCQLISRGGRPSEPVDKWKNLAIDCMLDAGLFTFIVADKHSQVNEDDLAKPSSLVEALYCSLSQRPGSRHFALLADCAATYPSLRELISVDHFGEQVSNT